MVHDLSMKALQVPGLRDYTPELGTLKDVGTSLTTLEVVNNMSLPYRRKFLLTDGDTVAGPVQADATICYTATTEQILDLKAVQGKEGVRLDFVLDGTGSLKLLLSNDGGEDTTVTINSTNPICSIFPRMITDTQSGWVAFVGGSGSSGGGQGTLYVTGTSSDDEVQNLSHSYDEILAAITSSRPVILLLDGGNYYPLISKQSGNTLIFGATVGVHDSIEPSPIPVRDSIATSTVTITKGVGTDTTSITNYVFTGSNLTRTFTKEVKTSEQLKFMITAPETFFAGHEGRDVSVIIRSGDYTLTKPYKDSWFWFKTEQFGTITVVCEDNVLIRLTFDFAGYDPNQDGSNSPVGKRVYFYTSLNTCTNVNWFGGRFTFLLPENSYTFGTQSQGGASSDINYNPFGMIADSVASAFGIFGNELNTFNGAYRASFHQTGFLFAVHTSLELFPVLVFDDGFDSNNHTISKLRSLGCLRFTQCIFLDVSDKSHLGTTIWAREQGGTSYASPATPWLACSGGDTSYPEVVPTSSPILESCIVQACFGQGTPVGVVGALSFGKMPGYIRCQILCPQPSSLEELYTTMDKYVRSWFLTIRGFSTQSYWGKNHTGVNISYKNDVDIPSVGGLQLTNLNYSTADVTKLALRLACGSYSNSI